MLGFPQYPQIVGDFPLLRSITSHLRKHDNKHLFDWNVLGEGDQQPVVWCGK